MRLKFSFLSISILFLLAVSVLSHGTRAHGQTIYCASDDGKRNYCSANTRGGVQMTNQRSGSACVQGQTWGFDNSRIWVDRGCRAEFTTGRGGNGWNNGNNNGGNNNSGTIYCASDDGKRNYCNANTRGGVQLTNQRSGSACVQGQTWGFDNSRIWVDRGCRAEFTTGRGGNGWNNGNNNGWNNGNYNGGGNRGNGPVFTCSSDDGRRHSCAIPNGNNARNVVMTNQRSGSPCTQGQTWGFNGNSVWVDRGCRADFQATR